MLLSKNDQLTKILAFNCFELQLRGKKRGQDVYGKHNKSSKIKSANLAYSILWANLMKILKQQII